VIFWHQQLPVYSPMTLSSIMLASRHALRFKPDPRPDLETCLRQEYDAGDVVLCSGGTEALQFALSEASQIHGRPPVVALPAYSCFDLATAAVGAGARVWIYDVDPKTLAPDLDSLERALKGGARIVVVSPLFGVPVNWAAVEECVNPYGGVVIEDAAQGHGATWRGRLVGSLGSVSVLSFGRGKGWSGCRGGALLVRGQVLPGVSGHLAGREPGLISEGGIGVRALAQWGLGRSLIYGLPASIPWLGLGDTRYREPASPRPVTRMAASLLNHTRESAIGEASVRRARAEYLLERIRLGPRVQTVTADPEGEIGYLRLPLRLAKGLAGFREPRQAIRLGVAAGYPASLAELPQLRARIVNSNERLPGGRELVRQLVTLPTHSRCAQVERDLLVRLINTYGR